ncbi:MAG: hypothetical protein FJ038_01715 [Chloroflexi bacterium]|nr:hypothetical protein [Chloroflexota bacterium]
MPERAAGPILRFVTSIPAHPVAQPRAFSPLATLTSLVARFWLPAWFALWTVADIRHRLGEFFASDTRIYARGALAFFEGRDPWTAAVGPFHFAGLPTTVQLFVPFALIPEDTAVVIGFAVALLAAVAIVRTLGLPWWWLLFPPLAHGVVVTNPHVLLTALLLTNRSWAEALAGLVKIYAVVPLGGRFRWRALALTAIGIGVSFALAPHLWFQYAASMAETTARLNEEAAGGFSAAIVPMLLVPMTLLVFLLWLRDRRAGSWLAVPALWPASQFFTQTFAMPLFARGPQAGAGGPVAPAWFAALLAIPSRGVVPMAIAVYVVTRLWGARQAAAEARRSGLPPPALDRGESGQ